MTREQARIYAKLSREDLGKINKGFDKHFDVLCAYANGAKVEMSDGEVWIQTDNPVFRDVTKYRVKPAKEAKAAGAYKPKDGEHYYYVSDHGSVIHTVCLDEEQIHEARFYFRNCFKTQEEAFATLDRVRSALKGEEERRERREINENEFLFSGKTYVAVEKNFCKGCAFWCSELQKRGEIPHCGAQYRKDGRDVIFVEKGKAKK